MKLLTRYSSPSSSAAVASHAGSKSGVNIPRPRLLVRFPYYVLLAGLCAIYYGYVISLNIRWLIVLRGSTSKSLCFITCFHFLFGMTVWSLLVAVRRGPGAVGEILVLESAYNAEAGSMEREADYTDEQAPLMTSSSESAKRSQPQSHKSRKRRQKSDSSTDEPQLDGHHRLQRTNSDGSAISSSDDGYNSDTERADLGEEGPGEAGPAIEIILPSTFNGKSKNISSEEGAPGHSMADTSTTLMAKANGRARFCRKCKLPKPDRAHHCSTCGFCILKMDHHCPWLGGCVGFKNYKPFVLFLFYADLLALFTATSSLWGLIQTMDVSIELLGLAPVAWGFLVLFGFLFTMMLSGFFPYHIYLAVNNRTTIENMERNGRLLSLPPRIESLVSAGTSDPQSASLPEQAKPDAGRLLDGPVAREQPGLSAQGINYSNPFLPATSIRSQTANATQSSNNALQSTLTRLQRRDLERTAGKINMYDLGTSTRNFREVFGADWTSWRAWVPTTQSRGTGYEFPINKAKFERLRRINEKLKAQHAGV